MRSSPETIRFTAPLRHVGLSRGEIAVAELRASAEEARKMAYQQGFEDASAFLQEQLAVQRGEVIQLQEETFKAIAAEQAAQIERVGALLPGLALEVARRVLAGLEPDAARIERTAAEVLAEMAPGTRDIEIMLHPADLAVLGNYDRQFQDRYPGLRFLADPTLKIGDCRMRSCFGYVDARLETKMENITRALQ